MSRVAVVRCEDHDKERVSDAVAEMPEAWGGAAQFTSATEEILRKPNILKGAPPESALKQQWLTRVREPLRKAS